MTDKIWISTDYVPKLSHRFLTPGKRYEAVDAVNKSHAWILDDGGVKIPVRYQGCPFLDRRDWTVHTSPEEPAAEPEMQVWHDEPVPQPSPVPGERLLFFTLGILASVLAFVVSAGLTWMVTR